jgi:TonB dependent receptor-like, beta-barrel
MFPRFGASGYTNLGGDDHRYSAFMSYTAATSLTKIHGPHNWKMGFEGRLIRVNVWEARSAGNFLFSPGATQGPDPNRASATAGNSIASELIGMGTTGNVLIQGWKNVASQSYYLAPYFQDDWHVSRKLTLNLGVRYDLDTPRTERYNRMNWFDPNVPSPLAKQVPGFPNLRGGVLFVGVNGNPRYQYHWDRNNLRPRLGLAYQATAKTVIRAGYSHVFGPSNQAAQGTVGPFGFRTENLWVPTLDGITPFNLLRNPYPEGFRPPPGASQGLLTQAGSTLQAPLQDTVSPWTQQWNFNVQRELPGNIILETAYVGTRGLQLSRNSESGLSLNQLDPQYLSLGPRLNDLVDNPFFGIVNNGVLVSNKVARAQLLRPYPQFTDIIPLFSSGSSSIYHALQVTFTKRFSRGVQFEGSYTWSKNMDNGMNHQDSYNVRASKALADIDIQQRFVMSYLYELPFGRGKKFGANASGPVNWLLGGWQFNGITTLQSGTPLSFSANNTAGIYNPVTWPNSNGKNPRLDGPVDQRLNAAFDTSVFSQPLPFTFGTLTPRVNLRNDGIRNFDLSIFKQFAPIERLRVQFRAELLNGFNTPRFGSPNTSVNAAAFGVINSQSNSPRQTQFGLKFLW